MPANNWGDCPKCSKLHEVNVAQLRVNADAAYGKVLVEEWREMDQAAAKMASTKPAGETLPEHCAM